MIITMLRIVGLDALSTNWTIILLTFQILFLLFYQVIFGYILSLILRIGLRIGVVKIVKQKKKHQEYDNDNSKVEWKVVTNFSSLMKSGSKPCIQCNYTKTNRISSAKSTSIKHEANKYEFSDIGIHNYNHDDNNDKDHPSDNEEELVIEPKYISVMSAIPLCRVGSIGLSPFMSLQGKTKRRTYFLSLSLKRLQLKIQLEIKIDLESNTIANTVINNGTNLKIDLALNIDTINVYLFSQGLIALLFRKVQKIFGSQDKDDGNEKVTKEAIVTTPLYLISKIFGGVDANNFEANINIMAKKASKCSTFHEFNHEAKISARKIDVILESKIATEQVVQGDSDKNPSPCRMQYICVDFDGFSIDFRNPSEMNIRKCVRQSITMKHFGFTLAVSNDFPTRLQVNSSESVEICASMTFIVDLLKTVFQIILPSVSFLFKADTREIVKDIQDIQRKERQNEQEISINTGIKLILVDDRDESFFNNSKSLELSLNVSLENNNMMSSQELSLVVSNVLLTQSIKEGFDGTLKFEMKSSSLLVTEEDKDQSGKEIFLDLGHVSLYCTNTCESEFIVGIIAYILDSLGAIFPRVRKTTNQTANFNKPLKCIAISCKSLDLVVIFSCFDDFKDEDELKADIKAGELLVSITPPEESGIINNEIVADGEAIVEVSNIVASLLFMPHDTLPTFQECIEKVSSSGLGVNYQSLHDTNRFSYEISGSQFKFYSLLPSKPQRDSPVKNESQQYFDIVVHELFIKEKMYSKSLDTLESEHKVAHCSKELQFILETSPVVNTDNILHVVQNIQIQTNSGTLMLTWSPIIQWFITSAVIKSINILRRYAGLVSNSKRGTPSSSKPKMLSNVSINTNDTLVDITAVLGGKSICDVSARNLSIEVSKNVNDTWDKPDVVCDVGTISANINRNEFDILQISSFRFSDTLRRASPKEIEVYSSQKHDEKYSNDEIVTGQCGTPLLERFELTFGDYTKVDMPPLLHLGKFIEDITQTERSVREGLFASGMIKKSPQTKRKYQIMDIIFNVPMIDANFLEMETSYFYKFSKFRGMKFGNHSQYSLMNRWRFHIKNLSVLIKRNSPPDVTQGQLQNLDEDKSEKYVYGPMIQGGNFTLNIEHVTCTLHPLNALTPLGDIKNLNLSGFIYLVALSSENKGIQTPGWFCAPVKCHHTSRCRCDFGVVLETGSPPVKIYYDVQLSSTDVHSNYGPLVNSSIPGLLKIIDRFIPSSPYSDERYQRPKPTSPPLSAWDNMRNQFHGQFSWKIKNVSFRWLLDTAPKYDWSILVTTKNLNLHHSVGIFDLELFDTIISIPQLSYHLLQLGVRDTIYSSNGEGKFNRHSLLFVPNLSVSFGFVWQVKYPEVNSSTFHHSSYLLKESLPMALHQEDQFEFFRSLSVKFFLKIDLLSENTYLANWVALRADVLPWLTHKFHVDDAEEEIKDVHDESNDDLNITGIEIDVAISQLCIGAWFDERAEFISGDSVEENIIEGVYINIHEAHYSLNNMGKNRIDVDGVQAALLDIDSNAFSRYQNYQPHHQCWSLAKWKNIYNPHDNEDRSVLNSLRIFECLSIAARNIKSLDYLLIVDQINVLDISLEEILHSASSMNNHIISSNENSFQKEKAPWTVLVAEMKLLWTLEIRDRVLAIVKDILFAINFMKVSIRGTPQVLQSDRDSKIIDKVSLDDTDEGVELTVRSTEKLLRSDSSCNAFEDTVIETESCENGIEINIETNKSMKSVNTIRKSEDSKKSNRPKSYLDYILEDDNETSEIHQTISPSGSDEGDKTGKLITTRFNSGTNCFDFNDATIPTFDLHLSNPQIQFHSEKTGGSVIIAMQGAYIEMKMYSHLFCKEEEFEKEDFTVETLLRRTEFLYTLDRMELYSLNNDVDMNIGLQWLGTMRKHNALNESIEREIDKYKLNVDENEIHLLKQSENNNNMKMFPQDLQKHETKFYILPPFCQKIMEPSTFKTLQTFHRPPIDLTMEELADTIRAKLIQSMTSVDTDDRKSSSAIDHVELFIDELSFLLDSHQFSTTLDVIRNVLLEPLKPDRLRHYAINNEKTLDTDNLVAQTGKADTEKSVAFKQMEEVIQQLGHHGYLNSRRGREYLRTIANDLFAEVEEKQGRDEPSIRRIEYTLCKAKWKVDTSDYVNDAEISFTGFKGIHDFTSDGSVNSQITLEDIFVCSTKPDNESMGFDDSTVIIKTVIGVERSSCCRCGVQFDRTKNEAKACKFHPGTFELLQGENIRSWSCCKALWEAAPGCASSPHTGKERAVAVRMDAFPRTVEGLTMYKHIEANIYPGVPHTIIVQLTKSLTKSFMKYFLGEGSKDEFIDMVQDIEDTNSDYSSARQRHRFYTADSSHDGFDELFEADESGLSDSRHSSNPEKAVSSQDSGRRQILFGKMKAKTKRKDSVAKKQLNNDKDQKSARKQIQVDGSPKVSKDDYKNNDKPEKKDGEIVFVKYWRVGDININISVAGFHRLVNLSKQGVHVPHFQKAYKIGSSRHLINKVMKHFIINLVTNSLGIIGNKIGGKQNKLITNENPAFKSSAPENASRRSENGEDDEQKPAMMILSPLPPRSRAGTRQRLYTR